MSSRPAVTDPTTVLIVDDQSDLLTVMSLLVKSFGYTTLAASSVEEAIAFAKAQPIDLLISDLNLQDGSGLDLVRQLQAIRPTKAIALSGFDDPEDIRKSLEAGFSEHLRKPVELPTLEKAIKTALAR